MGKPTTLGQLKASGYQSRTVKAEIRQNLLEIVRRGEPLFQGIVGFEETVVPQLENAVISGHDVILLGERGQAKTRLARSLVQLLDEEIPVIAGCEINDNPFHPICKSCREKLERYGDEAEIDWLPRERRYGEKLATPDITIADLIGEVDPIKVAEGRYLSDELVIHFGLIPRTNRGILCINELPDLVERIQVGLLNIMEERDVQIRGYKVRLPLDLFVVASANPEDYTNRGRIITPLKDRFGSQIRTHYPRTIGHEIAIMEQESTAYDFQGLERRYPDYMKEIVAELTHLARRSSDINQRSGVSVRMSICNYENLMSNALRRAVRLGEKWVVPRISDLSSVIASTSGKIELETLGEERDDKVIEKLLQGAVLRTFRRSFSAQEFQEFIAAFNLGLSVEVAENMSSMGYVQQVLEISGLKPAIAKLGAEGNPALIASAIEFILEGLHLERKLNKEQTAGKSLYHR